MINVATALIRAELSRSRTSRWAVALITGATVVNELAVQFVDFDLELVLMGVVAIILVFFDPEETEEDVYVEPARDSELADPIGDGRLHVVSDEDRIDVEIEVEAPEGDLGRFETSRRD